MRVLDMVSVSVVMVVVLSGGIDHFFALEILGLLFKVIFAHKELAVGGMLVVMMMVVVVWMMIGMKMVMVMVVIIFLIARGLLLTVLVTRTHATVIRTATGHRLVGYDGQVFEIRVIIGPSRR